jgi:hypothetical protein
MFASYGYLKQIPPVGETALFEDTSGTLGSAGAEG